MNNIDYTKVTEINDNFTNKTIRLLDKDKNVLWESTYKTEETYNRKLREIRQKIREVK